MKEVLILEDKSETRKVLAGLVKEVHSDAVIYEAADEKTAYDIAMKRTIIRAQLSRQKFDVFIMN